jgi:hypothetical protein
VSGLSHHPFFDLASPLPFAPVEDRETPVRFLVEGDKRLVIVKFSKKLTPYNIEKYARDLCAHPRFEPTFSEIADISEVQEVELDANDFFKLADSVDPFSLDSKRAFVARNAVQKHAARMHKILRTQRNFEIFESLEDAERWIAL